VLLTSTKDNQTMNNTPQTNEWRKQWAGESAHADPIVGDAVELMAKLESERNQLRQAAAEYIAEMDDYSRKSEKLRDLIVATSYQPQVEGTFTSAYCTKDDHLRYASRGKCMLCGCKLNPPNADVEARR
jgi:hypothetical protein